MLSVLNEITIMWQDIQFPIINVWKRLKTQSWKIKKHNRQEVCLSSEMDRYPHAFEKRESQIP